MGLDGGSEKFTEEAVGTVGTVGTMKRVLNGQDRMQAQSISTGTVASVEWLFRCPNEHCGHHDDIILSCFTAAPTLPPVVLPPAFVVTRGPCELSNDSVGKVHHRRPWQQASERCVLSGVRDGTPAHTIAPTHPPCLPAFLASQEIAPVVGTRHVGGGAVVICGGAGRPGVFPSHHHRHQPPVTLLETTVISINKQVHPCILFCVNLSAFSRKL